MDMARKKHRSEEIISKLRAMEVHIAKGLKTDEAARKEGITEQTYYRWRREYGGLKVDQAKRLKELEKENVRLKKPYLTSISNDSPPAPNPTFGPSPRPWSVPCSSPATAPSSSTPAITPRNAGICGRAAKNGTRNGFL